MHSKSRIKCALLTVLTLAGVATQVCRADAKDTDWPSISRTQKPWAYWWWMGSAVDPANITKELTRYQKAGMGGVHIIPIYGAKGWETNYINYLSPRWMEMLRYTVSEADKLDLGIDMTTGTGWCFGGPEVKDDEANASIVPKQIEVAAGAKPEGTFNPKSTQALMAFGPNGEKMDLLSKVQPDGSVDWTAPGEGWRVFAISQKPSGQKVKRPAPGGEGWMLNLFYAKGMTNYLNWFDKAFADYSGPKPRAQYHDSYEYKSDWAPDFFQQFEKREGYRLQDELPAFFSKEKSERTARVKHDYRETISDVMAEVTLPLWVKWSHDHGFLARNEAHGSPGNLLDLYAVADMPETEMFRADRDKLVSKFASSAAHVAGRNLCTSETGTWLQEHFTETLADMKYLLDDLYLSGVNHIFYHGTCYSPDEAAWPGWVFYAAYQMNPRNSVWHDVPALNAYAARCQSVLQSGKPDNDVLLYWPIHDYWSEVNGMVQSMTVHAREWLEEQPIGQTADWLWKRGYQFDYVSDHQLATAHATNALINVAGGNYRVIVVPKCEYMPVETMSNLVALANAGATVIFQDQLPKDVPGLGNLEARRTELKKLASEATAPRQSREHVGGVLVGNLEASLKTANVPREALFDTACLMCIRRSVGDNHYYFIANRGTNAFDGWLPLANEAQSVQILDPLDGKTGVALSRTGARNSTEVSLQLLPGESRILHLFAHENVDGPKWDYRKKTGQPIVLNGNWKVDFISGGPELPTSFQAQSLGSWTQSGDTNAQRFAGTARYTLRFDAPDKGKAFELDLGKVCQSARVRLNGKDLGTLFTAPFSVPLEDLKKKDNVLEVEVTNVSANRIRDLDQRKVNWKYFRDINFVNIDYKPFDASKWPLTDSGLLGPVTLTPLAN